MVILYVRQQADPHLSASVSSSKRLRRARERLSALRLRLRLLLRRLRSRLRLRDLQTTQAQQQWSLADSSIKGWLALGLICMLSAVHVNFPCMATAALLGQSTCRTCPPTTVAGECCPFASAPLSCMHTPAPVTGSAAAAGLEVPVPVILAAFPACKTCMRHQQPHCLGTLTTVHLGTTPQ